MNPKEFFDLVVKMRKAQKDYFSARRRNAPYEECNNLKNISKGFESKIDAEIDRVHRLLTEPELNFE